MDDLLRHLLLPPSHALRTEIECRHDLLLRRDTCRCQAHVSIWAPRRRRDGVSAAGRGPRGEEEMGREERRRGGEEEWRRGGEEERRELVWVIGCND
jgi:hypothetical protein